MQSDSFGESPILKPGKQSRLHIENGDKGSDDGYWVTTTDTEGNETREFVGETFDGEGKSTSAFANLQQRFPGEDFSHMEDGRFHSTGRVPPSFEATYDHGSGVVSKSWYMSTGQEIGEFRSGTEKAKVDSVPEWAKAKPKQADDGPASIGDVAKKRTQEQVAHPATPAPQQTSPDKSASQDYIQGRFGTTNSKEYLHDRYGIGTAGRPQPSPASGSPSHPLPPLGSAPKLPEPGDLDFPDQPALGDHPQEGKRRQHVGQAAELAESLDMALEQMLSVLDRMASKLQSVSQRLVVIESIIDRTY